MGKQAFGKIKKILVILLGGCILVSVTAIAVHAPPDPSWGPITTDNYWKAYNLGYGVGKMPGYNAGHSAGYLDCKTGMPKSGKISVGNATTPKSDFESDIGWADGYNDAYNLEYSAGYNEGYIKCKTNHTEL
jgi:hypothetical protein